MFHTPENFFTYVGGPTRCSFCQKTVSKFVGKYINHSVQKTQGVMVWAAMKGDGSITFRRCPIKVKSKEYQDILGSALNFIRPRCVPVNIHIKNVNMFSGQVGTVFNKTVHPLIHQLPPEGGLKPIK